MVAPPRFWTSPPVARTPPQIGGVFVFEDSDLGWGLGLVLDVLESGYQGEGRELDFVIAISEELWPEAPDSDEAHRLVPLRLTHHSHRGDSQILRVHGYPPADLRFTGLYSIDEERLVLEEGIEFEVEEETAGNACINEDF